MRVRFSAFFAVCLSLAAGCSGVLDEPSAVVDDDAAATEEDTGTGGPDEDASGDAPLADGGAKADTAVADAKPPADTGTVVTDSGASGDWPAAYATFEQQVLEETNKRRALGADCRTGGKFGPAKPLVMHPLLQAAARKHSKDMALNNFFAHTNLAGLSPFDRMKAEGYKGTTMGENIAAGNSTAAATVQQWMNSDGHCANIMSAKYTQLGVGYWYSATSKYRHYWTQNFGAGG
ncbi:MAG: CAP domain-containing protein [Deltaproteobacteria bacterium]|nr:CAP domain-containing protein [Deltaproteobacteria bacterium]